MLARSLAFTDTLPNSMSEQFYCLILSAAVCPLLIIKHIGADTPRLGGRRRHF